MKNISIVKWAIVCLIAWPCAEAWAQETPPAGLDSTYQQAVMQRALDELRAELELLRSQVEQDSTVVSASPAPQQAPPSALEIELNALFNEVKEDLEAAGFHIAVEMKQLVETLEGAGQDSTQIDIRTDGLLRVGTATEELEIRLKMQEVNEKEETEKKKAPKKNEEAPKNLVYSIPPPPKASSVRADHEKTPISGSSLALEVRGPSRGQWSGLSLQRMTPLHFQEGESSSRLNTGLPNGYSFLEMEGGSSWKFGLNPFQYRARLVGEYFGLTTGIGFSWSRIKVAANVELDWNQDTLTALISVADLEYKRHSLDINSLRVPLLLSYRSDEKRREAFHIETGAVIDLNLISGYHRKFKGNDVEVQEFTPGFNIQPFNVYYRLTVGYSSLSFVTEFPVLPIFKRTNTPEIYAPSFGLMLHI